MIKNEAIYDLIPDDTWMPFQSIYARAAQQDAALLTRWVYRVFNKNLICKGEVRVALNDYVQEGQLYERKRVTTKDEQQQGWGMLVLEYRRKTQDGDEPSAPSTPAPVTIDRVLA